VAIHSIRERAEHSPYRLIADLSDQVGEAGLRAALATRHVRAIWCLFLAMRSRLANAWSSHTAFEPSRSVPSMPDQFVLAWSRRDDPGEEREGRDESKDARGPDNRKRPSEKGL